MANIVVLTGAGVSAESGLNTFRGAGGLWEGHRVEDVATPEAFARNPRLVQQFYDARRAQLATVAPNPAHRALARLDAEWPGGFLLVTQNVDDLHERAGSRRLFHMHGELKQARCVACGARQPLAGPLADGATRCRRCGGTLRPDVVWFGEMPCHMEAIGQALAAANIFIAIGTSGQVCPAAGFVGLARAAGAVTIEVNPDRAAASARFDRQIFGPAGTEVPALVERLLATGAPD